MEMRWSWCISWAVGEISGFIFILDELIELSREKT